MFFKIEKLNKLEVFLREKSLTLMKSFGFSFGDNLQKHKFSF